MIMQKNLIRTFTLLGVALLAAIMLVLVWQNTRVKANRPGELNFGAVSLSAGQTLRFNVVNPGGSRRSQRFRLALDIYSLGGPDTLSGSGNGGEDQAATACTNNLRPIARREFCETTLLPGEAVSLDFASPAAGVRVTPVIILEAENSVFYPAATIEIREGGRTVFIHPGAASGRSGFNPQPDPPENRVE